jgi:hypothetical protein
MVDDIGGSKKWKREKAVALLSLFFIYKWDRK